MLKRLNLPKSIWLLAVIFFVTGYILFPLWQLLQTSILEKNTFPDLLHLNILKACSNSVLLSILTILGSAVIGVHLACILHYIHFKFKSFLSSVVLLPLAVPPMVGVMAFLFLTGENGLLAKILHLPNFKLDGWPAILIVHLYSFYPLFFLFVHAALKKIDNSMVEAAFSLGAGKLKVFYKIIFPQLIPAITGASLLVFMASMASFSAPFIYGGSTRFLTTEIYYAKINGDLSFSALLALLLAIISIIFLLLFRWYRSKLPPVGATKGSISSNTAIYTGKSGFVYTTILLLFSALIILPILALVLLSLLPEGALMQSGLSYHFTLENFLALGTNTDFIQPVLHTLSSSILAVLLTLFFALATAHILRGKKSLFKSALELTVSIPYGIPGTVIALCLILSFNIPNLFSFNQVLVGTFWILPVVYTIRNLPILTQAMISGLQAIDPSIEDAATTLGAGPFKIWRSITLPMLVVSIVQGCLLVFINSFGEFVATILLYTYATKTISVEVYSQLRLFNNGIAAAQGVVLFFIILAVVFLSRTIANK